MPALGAVTAALRPPRPSNAPSTHPIEKSELLSARRRRFLDPTHTSGTPPNQGRWPPISAPSAGRAWCLWSSARALVSLLPPRRIVLVTVLANAAWSSCLLGGGWALRPGMGAAAWVSASVGTTLPRSPRHRSCRRSDRWRSAPGPGPRRWPATHPVRGLMRRELLCRVEW